MSDLAKHERAEAAQVYAPRSEQVRAQSIRLIENVIKAHVGKPEIEVLLALGGVCPFGSQWDRAVWVEEVRRLMGERNA